MPFHLKAKNTKPTNNQPDNCLLCRFICSLKSYRKRSYYSDTPGKFALLKELKRNFLQIFVVDSSCFCNFVAENERFNQRFNQRKIIPSVFVTFLFVLSLFFHGFIYFFIAAAEFQKCISRDVETPTYIGNRAVPFQHADDDFPVFDQHIHFRVAAFFRPRTTPSAFRRASASLVRIEIRLRSISATKPKAKQSTLLLMELSNEYPSLVV